MKGDRNGKRTRNGSSDDGAIRIGLFISCYVGMPFSEVGISALELLGRLGFKVSYPLNNSRIIEFGDNLRLFGKRSVVNNE